MNESQIHLLQLSAPPVPPETEEVRMSLRRSLRRALTASALALAAVATTAVGTVSADAAEATEAAAPKITKYVALGDSYTSGPFIPWMRLDPVGCARSTNNYPSWLAWNMGISGFTDVSCGGADTTNMTTTQSVPLGSNAPQFNALKPDTQLVTLGIGGNDFSVFGDLTGVCPGLRASDPTGAPCKARFTVGGVDTMKQKLTATGTRVSAVLAGIHARSPQAKVVLVGYPRIFPQTGTCPSVLPFANGDYVWGDSVEQALNTALRNAASQDGRTIFVDTYAASTGHDACAGSAAWIQGKDTNLTVAAAYHPRKAAMTAEASMIQQALQTATVQR
jgi:lysophospholipase L1-like esterase